MIKVKSPPLLDLQKWMRWVLTHPHGVSCALKNHSHPLQHCVNIIGETQEVDRDTRLSIYGNGYFGRIIEVLESNFSSMKNIVGQDQFEKLARNYLIKHPSIFRSIDDIGHRMPEFVKSDPLAKKYPFLPDLAAIEWAAHQSFFADDIPLLDTKKFKNMPESQWQKAKFALDPSVHLLQVNWPVDEIWRADGRVGKLRAKKIKKEPRYILVYRRPDKMVRVPRISAHQFSLLTQLGLKKSLGGTLLGLVKDHSIKDEALPIKEWFSDWIVDGVIKKIEFDSTRR